MTIIITENRQADSILKDLKKIEWLAFSNPKFVRRKFNNYLKIMILDTIVTDDAIRSILSVADLHGTKVVFRSLNDNIWVEFLLNRA